jgi:hypothetical protein
MSPTFVVNVQLDQVLLMLMLMILVSERGTKYNKLK